MEEKNTNLEASKWTMDDIIVVLTYGGESVNANARLKDKFHRKPMQMIDARMAILERIQMVDTETLDLMDALGRRLAEDVVARDPLPHFRRSGMDGYAVRTEDITGCSSDHVAELEVIEQIPCGKVPIRIIERGQAARIMTGGMVPEGADAVIMLEVTEELVRDGRTYVQIRKADTRGANITPIGEEAVAGAKLMEGGRLVDAGAIALLAALGYAKVKVYRRPKVTILSTGSELLDISMPLAGGKIRNSNAYMLAAQVEAAGGEAQLIDHIPDEQEQAERILYDLLRSDADVIVTTGGVSVGDYDIMADFFLSWDGETLFNKLAMRPGSPTSAGIWNGKLIVGLSGNPSACFVGFELFIRPVILTMQGAPQDIPQPISAYLGESYLKVNAFTRYVRGKLAYEDGRVVARQVGLDKSSAVITLKDADCLIIIPPTKTGFRAGERVEVVPLLRT